MLLNIAIGLTTMLACLFLQSILLVTVLRFYSRWRERLEVYQFLDSLKIIGGVMLLLVAGNLVQAAIWALLFLLLGEFQQFAEAFYHSVVNFATLGYGDFVMSERYKLLGPLEAVNGVLMVGISSAILIASVQDVLHKARELPRQP